MRRLAICALFVFSCTELKSTNGSMEIGPKGGTFNDPRGLTLIIPPHAFPASVTVIAEVVAAPPSLPGAPVTLAWHVQPDQLQLMQPATLSLSTTAKGDAFIATAEDSSGPFESLASTVHDGVVTASISHFSIYVGVVDAGAQDDAGLSLDAGSDSGVADDAGFTDAGSGSDAGFDAGQGNDGGPADAGDFDAGDGTCGTPIFDGGGTVACASPAADGGACSAWQPWIAYWGGFGADRSCEDPLINGQHLECSGGICSCDSGDRQIQFAMVVNEVICPDLIRQLWTCQCGFPLAEAQEPICSAPLGGWDGGAFSLPSGSACSDGTMCQFGVCFNTGAYGWICSSSCFDQYTCPCGFTCKQVYPSSNAYYCIPP